VAPKTLRGAKTLPARTEVIVTAEQHSLSLLLVIIHFGSGLERWGSLCGAHPYNPMDRYAQNCGRAEK
jgi:hypothetical protein